MGASLVAARVRVAKDRDLQALHAWPQSVIAALRLDRPAGTPEAERRLHRALVARGGHQVLTEW